MNRRKFIGGAVAVAAFPLVPTPTYSKCLEVADAYIDQFLIVTRSGRFANEIHAAMGRPVNVRVLGPGPAICGYRADEIIVDSAWQSPSPHIVSVRKQDWYNSSILTRLAPKGRVQRVHFEEAQFDMNTQHAVAAHFLNDNGMTEKRHAIRIPSFTRHDLAVAHAELYKWWIEKGRVI